MSLRVEGVRKRFGATLALDGLDLEVPAGASYGLIGPNGAGKTTTMRLILSILAPDAGTIAWRGQPLRAWSRKTFGYLPPSRAEAPGFRLRFIRCSAFRPLECRNPRALPGFLGPL